MLVTTWNSFNFEKATERFGDYTQFSAVVVSYFYQVGTRHYP